VRTNKGSRFVSSDLPSCAFLERSTLLGPATRLTVTVKAPATSHEVHWGKVETWLQSAGKPNEQALKGRLRELLRC
jgi:hypothetical protein